MNTTRRTFLKTTAAATAAFGGLTPSSVLGANDRINFAVIGCGGMGTGHLKSLVGRSEDDNIKVVQVCDVYRERLNNAMGIAECEGTMDFREVLDNSDVDAVLIATPDHWHSKLSIDAMDAGKHVYCEKPLTLTVEQALEVRDAVPRFGKKLQVGPQRTGDQKYYDMQRVVQDGRIGKITWAQGSWNRNNTGSDVFGTTMVIERQAGPYQPKDSEGYIDWDMWLGHEWGLAPKVPWDPKRYFKFRGYWDYNGGVATDLLYHFLAPILKAVIGDDGGYPWRVTGNGGLYIHDDGREVPDTFLMTVDYPENFSVFMESTVTNEYFRPLRLYGQYGTITTSDRRPNLLLENAPAFREKFMELNDGYEEVVVAPEEQRRDMEGNLIDAIREDVPLHCNVDLGAATMVAIKMGVESYRQSKTLLWDGDDEKVYSL